MYRQPIIIFLLQTITMTCYHDINYLKIKPAKIDTGEKIILLHLLSFDGQIWTFNKKKYTSFCDFFRGAKRLNAHCKCGS